MTFTFNRRAIAGEGDTRPASLTTRILSDCLVVAGILAFGGLIAYLLPTIAAPIGPHGVPSGVSTDVAQLPYYAMR
ncbi:MAG: sulfonate ABC transporter permease, partial [Bifidobacterium mongoliense]|nr:sulfonate ABC transporter permease [Bifidobacterium mongoliense]